MGPRFRGDDDPLWRLLHNAAIAKPSVEGGCLASKIAEGRAQSEGGFSNGNLVRGSARGGKED
jgi:hypothetical protein